MGKLVCVTDFSVRVGVVHKIFVRAWLDRVFTRVPSIFAATLGVGQGPLEFINRLIKGSRKYLTYSTRWKKCDVILLLPFTDNFYWNLAEKSGRPIVLRFDGIGIDGLSEPNLKEYYHARLQSQINRSSGIIFQSNYCLESAKKIYKIPGHIKLTCIPNGAATSSCVDKKDANNLRNFMVGARNVPRKRVDQTIQCFLNSPHTKDCKLLIFGDKSRFLYQDYRLNYFGFLTGENYLNAIKEVDCLLHLDWYDWCPNLVVEAISMGIPVACGLTGGTHEIVGDSGVIFDFQEQSPDFKNHEMMTPKISQDKFDELIKKLKSTNKSHYNFNRQDLIIDETVIRYRNFFQSLMVDNRLI